MRSNRRLNSPASAIPDKARKIRDQIIYLPLGDVDVGIAQERHEVVRVGSQPRILEIDDEQPAVVQHQVAAVVVAMDRQRVVRRRALPRARSIPRRVPSSRRPREWPLDSLPGSVE